MATWDPKAFEDGIIEDMRAHGGRITTGPMAGEPMLVLHSTGARSGKARRAMLNFSRDAGDYIVAGTKGGAPTDPAWVSNIRTNPNVTIEAEGRTFRATGSIMAAAERDRLWAEHVRTLPKFADYPKTSGRVIPVIRLRPSGGN